MASRADMPKAGVNSVKWYVVITDNKGPFLTNESDDFYAAMVHYRRWQEIGIQPTGIQCVRITNFDPEVPSARRSY